MIVIVIAGEMEKKSLGVDTGNRNKLEFFVRIPSTVVEYLEERLDFIFDLL